MSDLNIYQRMAAITSALPAVPKSMEIGEGRFAYKAVREADILSAVKPTERKNGVYSYPYSREILKDGELTIQTKNGERTQRWVRMQTVYRFINTDNPEEYIDVTSFADGIDQADKALGKAMTYCDKYALMKAYKITTGDDSDQGGLTCGEGRPKAAPRLRAVRFSDIRHEGTKREMVESGGPG